MKAIHMANLRSKDLNLLNIFSALLAEKNVSKAAKRLALSQPAMSHALSRLRRDFGDDLFVRSGKGMAPTPRALQLEAELQGVIEGMGRLYDAGARFDPKKVEARFIIATTDYLEHLLLPRFLPTLRREAPGLTLIVRSTVGMLPKVELENGNVDVAVAGFFGELPEGFHRTEILDEDYLCIVRRDHPTVKDALTLAEFLRLDHVLVSPQGDLDGVIDKVLAKKGLKRRVVVGVSNFQTPSAIVAQTDCISTLPSRIAREHAEMFGLRCFAPPIPVPGFKLILVWHARTDKAPMQAWVRKLIAAALPGPQRP